MRHWFAIFIVSIIFSSVFVIGNTHTFAQQSRAELEADLANLEAQIKALNSTITQTKKQGASLNNDIALLSNKIKQSKLKIQAHDKAISRINGTISEKNRNIDVLDAKVDREKESLAQIMRKTMYLEQYSILDFGLQAGSLSTFFSDADSFSTLSRALNRSFEDIKITKSDLETVKTQLEEAKDEEQQKKLAQESEKKTVETNQKEKNTLLTITKNQEAEYKKVLAAREKEAAQIRSRLFELRDTGSISFGQAYDFALAASKTTGVRPALVLAILMQESSMGINVGACYLRDYDTGDGVGIRTGDLKKRTMHPDRDVPVFVSFLKKLGRDPQQTPVSCWIPYYYKGSPSGWGGAMGPSQFIPSTWQLFESRIEKITNSTVADPWKPYHAITATALYLSDLGAVAGNEASERNAACRYYSGRSCSSSSAGAGYGNSVMKKLYNMQLDIDKLQR
ncbi:lytic murein transglycosylase [Candidatus Gracilibacteria bacterium]|nr:lytic murein transglycosylase [Candidatus Gracilibacteria bacterium]MCF7898860.1 lytic murein transglycosylase [Candidatus Paceibacterota bacterium]